MALFKIVVWAIIFLTKPEIVEELNYQLDWNVIVQFSLPAVISFFLPQTLSITEKKSKFSLSYYL